MVKADTGLRWHWITYAIASLCFLLGGGLIACGTHIRTDEHNFINHELRLVTAEWHPQKNAVLFRYVSNGLLGPAFVISPDGSQSDTIIGNDNKENSSLSPDWSRLTYSKEIKINEQWDIFSSDADGSNQSRLTERETYNLAPVWSPDGSQIAFYSKRSDDKNLHLYTMASDGSGQRHVTSTRSEVVTPPIWSPDGNRIAFIAPRYGEPEHLYRDTDLYVAIVDGSSLYRVERMIGFPAWSPDSNRIAFLKHIRSEDKVALYTVRVDGSNLTKVHEFELGNEFLPWYETGNAKPSLAWSPDGSRILVSHRNMIADVNTDGSDFRMLMRLKRNHWSVQLRASWSPDGSKVIVASLAGTIMSSDFPDEHVALFTMEPDGSDRQILGWWLFEEDGEGKVIPAHKEPWPEHLKSWEATYNPPPTKAPMVALNPTPQLEPTPIEEPCPAGAAYESGRDSGHSRPGYELQWRSRSN